MYYIGIDVGGTNLKAGLVGEDGTILKRAMCPTLSSRPSEEIASDMAKLILEVAEGTPREEIHSVGIGMPGACDDKTGKVIYTANINFKDYPLGAVLEEKTGFSVYLGNDANCAAVGEYFTLPEKVDDMVFITLGTGVGGGLILGGKLYTGANGIGAEVGHIILKKDGEMCGCGRRGCWEAYASVTALIRQTREYVLAHPESPLAAACENVDDISGKTAFVLAKQGDAGAKEVVDTWISYVAEGIVDMINIFQPSVILIGGAISREGEYLLAPVREIVARDSYSPEGTKKPEIFAATLGNDAGLIGAAFLGR